ncbi:antichymotrypsin-2-like [Cydia pomonella]|uniref:antichymotrypsin-2-like n=1 Tax=Cydia pomonella TaxID=82600 RepID=UPI002ADE47C3|nr:antichymotrypsin-2-like [Cydia pomonella]
MAIFQELEKGKSQVCSPLSAQAVLALTALGSGGDTRKELLQAMALPDDEAIRSLFGYLTSTLNSIHTVKLRFANRIYVSKHGTLKPGIQKDSVEVFGSSLQQVDFMEKEGAADSINKWIAAKTNNMIRNIVSPDSLHYATRLLLVNAIYFQGTWEKPFEKDLTKERIFHVNNRDTVEVPMMFMDEEYFRYRHSPELKAQLLQMNYKGRQASMILIVPDAVEGLGAMLQQLSDHDLMDEVAVMRATRTEVMIPKFKIETDINLEELLPKMGIHDIFDQNKSDIRMFTSDDRMCVTQAIQRAVIEVNETGTEAAACTLTAISEICAVIELEPPKRFVADRPFLYLLLARGVPTFIGVYHQ